MKIILFVFVALGLVFAIAPKNVKAESATVAGAKEDYAAFKKDMTEKLAAVDKQLKKLKTEAHSKSSDVTETTVRELQEARTKLNQRLEEMKDESGDRWTDLKTSIAKSMDELNSKVQKAMKK